MAHTSNNVHITSVEYYHQQSEVTFHIFLLLISNSDSILMSAPTQHSATEMFLIENESFKNAVIIYDEMCDDRKRMKWVEIESFTHNLRLVSLPF